MNDFDPSEPPDAKLSNDEIKTLQAASDTYRQAQRQILDAVGVLWNAQLDLAIRQGQVSNIRRSLIRPAFWDNCNCGGGGTGAACW